MCFDKKKNSVCFLHVHVYVYYRTIPGQIRSFDNGSNVLFLHSNSTTLALRNKNVFLIHFASFQIIVFIILKYILFIPNHENVTIFAIWSFNLDALTCVREFDCL